MKKSNKLILGGFLLGVLFLVALHVTLYAKYKNGDYTIYNDEDDYALQTMQSFPNILFVSVRNIPDASIKFGSIARVNKDGDESVHYQRKGDTLLITGKEGAPNSDVGRPIVLSLPSNATLTAVNSTLTFTGGSDTTAKSHVMVLSNSNAYFIPRQGALKFLQLSLSASENSNIIFRGNTHVDQLDVKLSGSSIEYSGAADCNAISIETDNTSHISFPTKLLLKAKIKTTATE